ncbi:hypothetical protein ETU37_00455 [Nocardioides iriomotensis]|uniref:Glycoside-hydrolase family GH114 TIM-barrel domain-containing protein n=1 Tax=Nocardioides iriomotensis TaxID=715784 RepID=A0A4Q5JCJ4_9ACTN|nr:hypothetical protein ETU37_00455 [Nocardioides iriomotensis]
MPGVARHVRFVLVLLIAPLLVPFAPASGAPVLFDPDADVDYQLSGGYDVAAGIVVRDRTDEPAPGAYNLCYVNAFQTQPGALSWWRREHPGLLLRERGRLVRDPGWPDEALLDTRTAAKRTRIAAVLDRWVAGCARDGFDAVEPDNLDSFTRSEGLLRRRQNLALATLVVRAGHRHGLAVAQKNLAELPAATARAVGFDLAVAEDCQVYDECGRYRAAYGRAVLEVEYADDGRAAFREACALRGPVWPIVLRDRDLRLPDQKGYRRDAC